MKKEKFNIMIIIVVICVILVTSVGITLAINNDKENNIEVNTLELAVEYSDVLFSSDNLVPVSDNKISISTDENVIKAMFNVKASPEKYYDNIIYDVMLKDVVIDCELMDENVKFNLYKNNELISSGNLSPKFDKDILNNKLVLTNKPQKLLDYNSDGDNYILIIWISDPCENLNSCTNYVDQSNMIGKKIEGRLSVGLNTIKQGMDNFSNRNREVDIEYRCN